MSGSSRISTSSWESPVVDRLLLLYMDGYLAREVAGMLDVPLGTVLARLHRGRKLFEKQLWNYADTNGLLREATN